MSTSTPVRPRTGIQAPRHAAAHIAELAVHNDFLPSWADPRTAYRIPALPDSVTVADADEPIVRVLHPDGTAQPIVTRKATRLTLVVDWDRWQRAVLLEHYATWKRRPLHTRSPVSYRIVPSPLRRAIALRGRRHSNGTSDFPALLIDSGFTLLRDILRSKLSIGVPAQCTHAVCLTHDIDTVDGFQWARRIAEIEASLGFRSSWNVVADDYPVDYDVLDELRELGFEIGLHGLKHDNRLIYLPESQIRARMDRCRPLIERFGIAGFRSPSWLRNEALFGVLPDYVDYDCSTLDFDRFCPAGPGGVLSTEPFMIGNLAELPTTIPFDSPDVTGLEPTQIVDYWRPKIRWLADVRGCAVVSTHPDPPFSGNERMLTAYRMLLEALRNTHGGRPMLPRDLARLTREYASVRL